MGDSKVEVETFGAVSLNSDHVRFIRDDFAELKFVGKKGGTNIANIRDKDVLAILQGYVDNAFTRGSKHIFPPQAVSSLITNTSLRTSTKTSKASRSPT